MAFRGSADVAFLNIGGYDVLGSVTNLNDKSEAVLEESHTLGDAWREQAYVGLRFSEITQEGFYDDGPIGSHAALSTGPGVGRVLMYGLEGTATGARVLCYESAMQVNYEIIAARGALTKAKATYRSNGAVEEGRLLRTYKVTGATGASTGTPVDNGTSTVADPASGGSARGGGAGYFAWNSTAGEGNFRILDSADNITYAALFTFTKTTTGTTASGAQTQGAERIATTGAIQRYAAVDYTTATATGGAGLNYVMALVRGLST